MNISKRTKKPVLLNLSHDIFDRVAIAAHEQNVTKTQFLRQSVERNLSHYEKNERSVFANMFIQGMA